MVRERYKGHIAVYKQDRGFGFIVSDTQKEPIFFHYNFIDGKENSALYAHLVERGVSDPLEVSFEIESSSKGIQARRIRPESAFSDIGDFLKSPYSAADDAPDKFLEMVSMNAIAYIDQDSTLTQFTVSRIIRSVETWDRLTSLAKLWVVCTSYFDEASSVLDREIKPIRELLLQTAYGLGLQPKSAPEIKHDFRAAVLPLESVESPLRCFREAQNVSLILALDDLAVSNLAQRAPQFLASTKDSTKLIIRLKEGKGSTPTVRASSQPELAVIPQRLLIEATMRAPEERPIVIGRGLRSVLPMHWLQPYELGSAYVNVVFAGRAQERYRILESLESNHAVYGGRKIGKTWFLKDICHWCKKEPYSSLYTAVYVSLQGAESAAEAAQIVLSALDYYFDAPRPKGTSELAQLGGVLLDVHRKTKRTILLALDEVDDILKSESSYQFFAKLRQLQQTYPSAFKFIFAGFKELMKAFYDETSNNPFANWVGNNHFPLGCLSEADLQSLIVVPLRWLGLEFQSEKVVEAVFDLTSGHPYYVQSLCHGIVKNRLAQESRNLPPRVIQKLASEEFFDEVFDVFIENLAPLQLLIGKVFADKDDSFSEADIQREIHEKFGIEISQKRLREEMRVLQACSVFTRTPNGYRPVMQRINQEFFFHQDDEALALMYLESQDGTKSIQKPA